MQADQVVVVDVLVAGGSGAAMMSAISALREGAEVAVVSKGKIGKSGNAIMIGGGFSIDGQNAHDLCGETSAPVEYTADQLYKNIVKCSFFLSNQNLARQYTDAGPYGVRECLKWAMHANAKFLFFPPASLWNTCGRHFGKALRQSVKDYPEIRIFEDSVVTDLLKDGRGHVCGALAIDVYSGKMIEFRAKAVIIATGGVQPFSLKNSCSDMTGDGIAMAVRAGASAADMEFYLFIPTLLEPQVYKGSIIPYMMTLPVYFPLRPKATDLDGCELPIAEKYRKIPGTNKMNKIMYAYFWGKGVFEKYAQYGNAFYFDLSDYSDQDIIDGFSQFIDRTATWYKRGFYNGVNLNEICRYILEHQKRLKVGLGNEYSSGGIVVDEHLATELPGLYAAGEVTSGVFGAFRSADGITEMLAHGVDAGKNAALYAGTVREVAEPVNRNRLLNRILAPLNRDRGSSAPKLLREIEAACDDGMNFFRDQEGLERCEKRLAHIEEDIRKIAVKTKTRRYNLEWLDALRAENICLCARMGVHAAAERKESRGTHMRRDYPVINNREYLYNIVARYVNGTLQYRPQKPVIVDIKPDAENVDCIPDYILNSMEDK